MPTTEQITPDVTRIELAPKALLNAYLIGDVLVDSGMFWNRRGLFAALSERTVTGHVLTHAHLDHAANSAAVSKYFGVPVSVGSGDLRDLQAGRSPQLNVPGAVQPVAGLLGRFRKVSDAVALVEGDAIGHDFVAIETPGHSPGHLAFWRERDRLLIAGDALLGIDPVKFEPGLQELPSFDRPDPAAALASTKKLAALEPMTVLFGHGPPLHNAAATLERFAATLR